LHGILFAERLCMQCGNWWSSSTFMCLLNALALLPRSGARDLAVVLMLIHQITWNGFCKSDSRWLSRLKKEGFFLLSDAHPYKENACDRIVCCLQFITVGFVVTPLYFL
jgi:hypothetical protein